MTPFVRVIATIVCYGIIAIGAWSFIVSAFVCVVRFLQMIKVIPKKYLRNT